MRGHWVRSQILVQNNGALGENVMYDLSVSALKAGIWKKKSWKWQKWSICRWNWNKQTVASCASQMQKNTGSLGESDRRAHFSPKNVGSLGDSSSVQIKWSSGRQNARNCRRTTWTSQQVIRGTTRLNSPELEYDLRTFSTCFEVHQPSK